MVSAIILMIFILVLVLAQNFNKSWKFDVRNVLKILLYDNAVGNDEFIITKMIIAGSLSVVWS